MNGGSEHVKKVLAEMEEAKAATAEDQDEADEGNEVEFPTEGYVALLKSRGL